LVYTAFIFEKLIYTVWIFPKCLLSISEHFMDGPFQSHINTQCQSKDNSCKSWWLC